MPKFARCRGIWVCTVLLVWGPLALAGESVTSEWPCIQHKVPEITAGIMWAGPEIDARDRRWQESPAIAPLAYRLAKRRLPIEEAVNEIDAFAKELSEYANRQHGTKRQVARLVHERGVPLTINAVIHRQNIDHLESIIELARDLDAGRLEVAHTQYYGWALKNRATLMPTLQQIEWATEVVDKARSALEGRLVIDYVAPDCYARFPKPCMGGWGRISLNVTPSGKVLPCHAAETITHLAFDNVREKSLSEIWETSESFKAFRGLEWMEEPCRSCERKALDWGGCRCQAFALAGRARATDPACSLSPLHGDLVRLASEESAAPPPPFACRRIESKALHQL